MISRIFLDIDDTLNSFSMFILKSFGCKVGEYDYHVFPEVGYDVLAAYNLLKPENQRPLNAEDFWTTVKRQHWATAPRSHEFSVLIGFSESLVGKEGVCLLTAPTKDPDSLSGKLDWIHDNCPTWLHRQFLVGPPKHFCAHPEALLIDDNDDKVNKFREHGGRALLVPRPWNSLRGTDTLAHVQNEFITLFRETRSNEVLQGVEHAESDSAGPGAGSRGCYRP